ncbi:MAG TPA: geranylgeranyl reductase family protein [Vicinamibacterales bacterium]
MRAPSIHDVLVVGAGPAGAAAAWALARAGHDVALVDREAFPRDKTCGDGLISDSLEALDEMGLRQATVREAVRPAALHVVAPGGESVRLAGEFLCLPRQRFDALLVEAAVNAGARLEAPMSAVQPLEDGGVVSGARLRSPAGELEVRARFTMLATGANAAATNAFGLSPLLKPNAVAGRAYFRVPSSLAARHPHLSIVYERSLCPGYGWIFPGPGNRYNLGVGCFSVGGTPTLRELWERFITRFAPAAEMVARSEALTEFRGAPLRTGLHGATLGRPGLLALGDAAAMTYPATGEGVGKAMQSGLLAARLVSAALAGAIPTATVHRTYDVEFRRRFAARYQAYWTVQAWSSRPWLLDRLASRANAGGFVRRELEALIAETGDPLRLFSVRGLVRAVVG